MPCAHRRVLVVVLTACAVLVGACLLAPVAWRGVVTVVVSAGATAAYVVRLRRAPVPDPAPLRLLTVGLGVLTVHNAEAARWTVVLGEPVGRGVLHDVTLPLGYAAVLVAALLAVFRYARRDTGGVIESVLVGITSACLLWVVAIGPALARAGAGTATRVYELVLLLLIAGIAGGLVRAMTTSRTARPALGYLGIGLLATLVGNVVRVLTTDGGTGAPASWNEVSWIVANLAVGAAALHPALDHLSGPGLPRRSRLTTARLTALGLALSTGPVLVGVEVLRGDRVDVPLLLVGSFLVVVLVMLRVAGLARLHATAEAELARIATHDELTGLPNRRAIDRHLEQALDRVAVGASPGLVTAFLDLDDLKRVNDLHGHEAGDRLLAAVAGRLHGVVREEDLVGRFGGDEFVVVVEGRPDDVWPEVLERVGDALAEPVALGEVTASARASIGTAEVRPGQRTTAAQVLARADAQMYERKRELRAARGEPGRRVARVRAS